MFIFLTSGNKYSQLLAKIMLLATVASFSLGNLAYSSTGRSERCSIEHLEDVRFFAYQIQDQSWNGNDEELAGSHYDLLVIDQTRSIKGEEDFDSRGEVELIKNSENSSGGKKAVVCYIDVGEAESYRWYWQAGWSVGSPEWIVAPDPGGWDENYPVKFWMEEWKDIMKEYIDRIIDDGYDGIYLDWLEVYSFEPVAEAAEAEGLDPRQELVGFVGELAQYARSIQPGFQMIAQNAAELGSLSEYVGLFDGIAQEAIWYDGGGDPDTEEIPGDVSVDPGLTEELLVDLAKWQRLGKLVFNVEYAQESSNVKRAYRLGSENGFTTYVTLRPLDALTETPPPGYQSEFYFAEGYTGPDFQEYLCIGNANNADVATEITYTFKDGTSQGTSHTIPANSRYTIDVNGVVGTGREVSIRVFSESPNLVAERSMYFDYQGRLPGGHAVLGAITPDERWYFAEGTTRPGFDELITVLNPSSQPAGLTFNYMVEGEGEADFFEVVAANSRATFKVVDHVGMEKDVSLLLESDKDVVCERSMYFDYQGLAPNDWRGGHCVVGTTSIAKEWYFAEGTTRSGFEEWLCLQNPSSSDININACYLLGEGQGEPVNISYVVPSMQRLTLSVNEEIGAEKDVSVELTSDSEFIAERSVYFNYHDAWDGGHGVLGARRSAKTWLFAEGYTGENFEEWVCIQNPGEVTANVTITYYPEGGDPIVKSHTVDADSRYTVGANSDAGAGLSISAKIESDEPIICERPVYFDYDGSIPGGHDVMGYAI